MEAMTFGYRLLMQVIDADKKDIVIGRADKYLLIFLD
jgi:hypothetical protein